MRGCVVNREEVDLVGIERRDFALHQIVLSWSLCVCVCVHLQNTQNHRKYYSHKLGKEHLFKELVGI